MASVSKLLMTGINLIDDTAKYVRTCGKKSILQTKSLHSTLPSSLVYSPKSLADDVFTSLKKVVDNDSTLFSWVQKKPEFSLTSTNPDSMVLIHMTNYFPKRGQILSANSATRARDGVGLARTTVHFSINKPVTEHSMGNSWNTMDYSIILPFKETVKSSPRSKVLGGMQDDFFFQDGVSLPKGSVIIKYNSGVGDGKLLVSDAFDGVKLVETSNRNLSEVASNVIKKMGYTTYSDALKKSWGASDKDVDWFNSLPESQIFESLRIIEEQGGVQAFRKILDDSFNRTKEALSDMPEYLEGVVEQYNQNIKVLGMVEKYSERMKSLLRGWEGFCVKDGYVSGLHASTPWFKTEMSIYGVELIEKMNSNSWGNGLKSILLNALDDVEKNMPKGKDLGVDIKHLKTILEESPTPSVAKKRIADELKLKPMPPREPIQEGMDFGEAFVEGALNTLFGRV